MESRAKLVGHPIHQMLIVVPLGPFVVAVLMDLIQSLTGNTKLRVVSLWNIGIGLLGGLVAAVFGVMDWLSIPSGTRAKSVGLFHGLGNAGVLSLFGLSWLIRRDASRRNARKANPGRLGMALSFLGLLVGTLTGWLGGELVDRLGVGVDRGANLNAPNSLSGQPADVYQAEMPVG